MADAEPGQFPGDHHRGPAVEPLRQRDPVPLAEEGEPGRAIIDRLTADPLVEGLLLLHGLHPLDADARIQRALDQVRPYLGSHAGGVQYLGVTDGVARLRLEGSCHGCPSSTVTVRLAIEGRAALSPDAMTGLEANLRFAGPETLETKIFGRLTAWQNWIFQRPNAVGDRGALKNYGKSGARPEFDWRRT